MDVLMVLTNGFDPDPRVYKEAKILAENGYEVEILAWDRDGRYKGREDEMTEGIKVRRFFIRSAYGSGTKQMSSYLKFCMQARRYASGRDYRLIHAHDIDGMFAAVMIARHKKIIWDMHEFFDGFDYGTIRKTINRTMARICFRYADAIIYVVDSQRRRYASMVRKKTLQETVMNCADLSVFSSFSRQASDKLRISFIGTVREFDTIKLMMDVAEKFDDVVFYIHGGGVSYEDIKAISGSYRNTVIQGRFDFKDVKQLYQNTDIVYSIYDSTQLNIKEAFPAKGFEAIISETPVITNKNTYFGDLVQQSDIGFVIDERSPDDLEALVGSLLCDRAVLHQKAENIKKIKKDFLWETQSDKLLLLYKKLIG